MDLPAEDGGLVKRVLVELARRFDNEAVSIDQKVANPSRIVKLYGTKACKGDHTEERPHRWSQVLEVPETVKPVPISLMEELAGPATQASRASSAARPDGSMRFREQLASVDRPSRMSRAKAYLEKAEPAVSGRKWERQGILGCVQTRYGV